MNDINCGASGCFYCLEKFDPKEVAELGKCPNCGNEGGLMEPDHIAAHKFSSNHKSDLRKDGVCGCFYCLETFDPRAITDWVPDKSGTAICPYCGIDSIIGESSGYPIATEFLKRVRDHWF